MTHLRIELNNIQENVSSAVIEKLYELASSGDLDNTSNLAGTIHVNAVREIYADYLNNNFSDLHVTADKLYLTFSDPVVDAYWANSAYGDGSGITRAEANTVLSIPNNAFEGNSSIRTFNELNTLVNCTSIGSYAFSNSGLTSINLSNIATIGEKAFRNCSGLTGNINMSNITSVGNSAFYNTGITSVNAPLLTSMSSSAFANCTSLLSMTISSSTTSIGYGMFYGDTSLSNLSGFSNVTALGFGIFKNCDLNGTIDLDFTKITDMAGEVFSSNKYTGPVNLSSIESFTQGSQFTYSKITSLTVGGTVAFIPGNFCTGSSNLTSVTLNSNITSIGNLAFGWCSNLTTITGMSAVLTLGSLAFKQSPKITAFDFSGLIYPNEDNSNFFGDNLLFLGYNALTTLGITSIPWVTTIPAQMFNSCLELQGELSFPNATSFNANNYGSNFAHCKKLVKLSFPKVENIECGSQWNASDRGAFGDCLRLKIVDLGDSLELLYPNNFAGCLALLAVVINNSTVPYNGSNNTRSSASITDMFGSSTVNIYVPDAAVTTYLSTLPFSNFPDNIKPISQYNESNILAS